MKTFADRADYGVNQLAVVDADGAEIGSVTLVMSHNESVLAKADIANRTQAMLAKGSEMFSSLEQSAESLADTQQRDALLVGLVTGSIAVLVIGIALYLLTRGIFQPLARTIGLLDAVSAGEQVTLDDRDRRHHPQNEVGKLMASLDQLIRVQRERITLLDAIAEGDLSVDPQPAGPNDAVAAALARTLTGLRALVDQLRESSTELNEGIDQLAGSGDNLASSASRTAATVEEIGSAISLLSKSAQEGRGRADEVAHATSNMDTAAGEGREQIEALSQAVAEIEVSAKEIAGTMKAIEEIAFQTNLLSLNAGVEAARAGGHGKGFAVVASEVRTLAQRSSRTSKASKAQVEAICERVAAGVATAASAVQHFSSISEEVAEVRKGVQSLAESSRNEVDSILQIERGLGDIDQTTQSNAAIAEETSSKAQELNAEAQALKDQVSRFRLED